VLPARRDPGALVHRRGRVGGLIAGAVLLATMGTAFLPAAAIAGVARYLYVRKRLREWKEQLGALGLKARTWNHTVRCGVEATDGTWVVELHRVRRRPLCLSQAALS
jgi:hypothetical protein